MSLVVYVVEEKPPKEDWRAISAYPDESGKGEEWAETEVGENMTDPPTEGALYRVAKYGPIT